MHDLPLEVRQFHAVAVHDDEMPHARGGEIHRHRRAQPPEPDNEHARIEQFLLAVDAHLREQDMTAVAQELFIIHGKSNGTGSAGLQATSGNAIASAQIRIADDITIAELMQKLADGGSLIPPVLE